MLGTDWNIKDTKIHCQLALHNILGFLKSRPRTPQGPLSGIVNPATSVSRQSLSRFFFLAENNGALRTLPSTIFKKKSEKTHCPSSQTYYSVKEWESSTTSTHPKWISFNQRQTSAWCYHHLQPPPVRDKYPHYVSQRVVDKSKQLTSALF